jgi:23S rRNA (guanosine2251-2'-O)-methyltransferase
MKTIKEHKHNTAAYQSKKNIIVGKQAVLQALHNHVLLDKILVNRQLPSEFIMQLRQNARVADVPVQIVPLEKLNRLTNMPHQGIVALKASIAYQKLQQVIDWVNDKGETPLFIMLDGITDVRNIGAIARSAVCFGAHAVIIPNKGVGALNEEAVRASAGALEQIAVCRVESLIDAVQELHLNGIHVMATTMRHAKKIYEIDGTVPCCIIMGSEEKGVHEQLLQAADEVCFIPMQETFDSLNVSVATGIFLYEIMKQRQVI